MGLWFPGRADGLSTSRREQLADDRKVDWLGFPITGRSGGNAGHLDKLFGGLIGGRTTNRTGDRILESNRDRPDRRSAGRSGHRTTGREDQVVANRENYASGSRSAGSRSVGSRSAGSHSAGTRSGGLSWGWTEYDSTSRTGDRIGDRTWGQIIERNTKRARQRADKNSRKQK